MVEAVGAKAVSPSDLRIAPVVRAPAPAASAPVANDAGSALAGLARAMAASAPVNTDRVTQIKAAIANGTYPIMPETIADRLIALQLEWNPDDQA
jgi:negative regulator of flagellin synthesis FlgM